MRGIQETSPGRWLVRYRADGKTYCARVRGPKSVAIEKLAEFRWPVLPLAFAAVCRALEPLDSGDRRKVLKAASLVVDL